MMVCYKFIEIWTMLCIINTTIAFKCWCCSSDERDSQFCGNFLDESSLTRYQREVNLIPCDNLPHEKGRNLITKCVIRKTSNNGTMVYSRSCIWEDANAEMDSCISSPPPYGHRMEACETCYGDKCNYRLQSESHNRSTQLMASMFPIMYIGLVIVLKI